MVKLISEDRAHLEYVEPNYWINYNPLMYKGNGSVELEVQVESANVRIKPGCMSCTTASILESKDNIHRIRITYDTKIVGTFTKTVTFFYLENGQEKPIYFKIKGTVK